MTAMLFDFPAAPPAQPKARKPKAKPQGYTDEFLTFWNAYPPRFNSSKLLASRAWNKLTIAEREQAMIALPIYARHMIGRDQEYTKHAASWLNGKYFETIAAPRQTVPSPNTAGPDWPTIMKLYRMTGNWKQEHGPAPGSPKCRAPANLLGDMA